jgi:hypothetical protein
MHIGLPSGLRKSLLWVPELKLGYHPAAPIDYNGDYFEKYIELDNTAMGAQLTALRCAMVRRHYADRDLVDVGIGGGRFCIAGGYKGFDVNKSAVSWLEHTGRFFNPYAQKIQAITCWDSLEHIPEPEKLLAQIQQWLFVSLPIFKDEKDCLASKHYKPGEHIWYFTYEGFLAFCQAQGFALVEWNSLEVKAGREGINSYAFRRVSEAV